MIIKKLGRIEIKGKDGVVYAFYTGEDGNMHFDTIRKKEEKMRESLCTRCMQRGHIKDEKGNKSYWCYAEAEIGLTPLHGAIVECSEFIERSKFEGV